MLLNVLQCTRQPLTIYNYPTKLPIVPLFRSPTLDVICVIKILALVAVAKIHLGIFTAKKPVVSHRRRNGEKDSLVTFDG